MGQLSHWNPDSFKVGLCGAAPVGQPHAVLSLSNNCCVATLFRGLLERFHRLYRRRAHVHHFTQYMQLERFEEAREAIESIASDYERLQSELPSPEAQLLLD